MDKPNENERPMLNMTIQMMYHKYVSKKNNIKSMTYMMTSVIVTWLVQRTFPKILSLHPWTFVRAMTAIGLLNDAVKKKKDSANLQLKIRIQRSIDAVRALRGRSGYDAVKV